MSVAEAFNDDMSTSSTLSLNNTHDNYGNNDTNLFVDLELPSHQHIQLSYGKSIANDDLSNTRQIGIGVSTDPYDTFSLGSELSYWGNSEFLESRTFRSDLTINLENWSVSLSPQLSVITVYLNLTAISQYDIYALGNDITLSYFGLSDYIFSASYFVNHYGDSPFDQADPRLRARIFNQIPLTTRQLAQSLENNRTHLSVVKLYNWGSLGLDWSHSNFAFIDSATSTTLTADYNINKTIGIGLGYGLQTSSENNSNSSFINTTLYLSW